jgi:HEAT repeat protein
MFWQFKFVTYSRSFSLGLLLSLFQSLAFTPQSMAQIPSEKGGLVERSCTADEVDTLVKIYNKEQLATCGESAMPHLIQILSVSQDWSRRGRAVQALGKIGGPDATKALIQTVNTDQDVYVRGEAVRVLGKIGGPDVTKALIQIFSTDRSTTVRWTAIDALGQIGGPDVLPTVISALHDPNSEVRDSAIVVLLSSSSEEAVQALNENESIVSQFIRQLGQEKRPRRVVINGNLVLLKDKDSHPYNGGGVSAQTTQHFTQRRPLACKLTWFANLWATCK